MKISKMGLRISCLVALLSASAANANDAWTTPLHVTQLYPSSDGFHFFTDGSPFSTNPPCGNRFFLPAQTGGGYDGIVSTIITAFTAGYYVSIAYDDTTLSNCDIVINRVVVTKTL